MGEDQEHIDTQDERDSQFSGLKEEIIEEVRNRGQVISEHDDPDGVSLYDLAKKSKKTDNGDSKSLSYIRPRKYNTSQQTLYWKVGQIVKEMEENEDDRIIVRKEKSKGAIKKKVLYPAK